jgi:hypothetical protein
LVAHPDIKPAAVNEDSHMNSRRVIASFFGKGDLSSAMDTPNNDFGF